MNRATPFTTGWTKTARKEYTHDNGVVVRYRHNDWCWEIIGGPECGSLWQTLNVAQYNAVERWQTPA